MIKENFFLRAPPTTEQNHEELNKYKWDDDTWWKAEEKNLAMLERAEIQNYIIYWV